MAHAKELSELEIASKIKAGKTFFLNTVNERRHAYFAAKYLGKTIKATEQTGLDAKFKIQFVND